MCINYDNTHVIYYSDLRKPRLHLTSSRPISSISKCFSCQSHNNPQHIETSIQQASKKRKLDLDDHSEYYEFLDLDVIAPGTSAIVTASLDENSSDFIGSRLLLMVVFEAGGKISTIGCGQIEVDLGVIKNAVNADPLSGRIVSI